MKKYIKPTMDYVNISIKEMLTCSTIDSNDGQSRGPWGWGWGWGWGGWGGWGGHHRH